MTLKNTAIGKVCSTSIFKNCPDLPIFRQNVGGSVQALEPHLRKKDGHHEITKSAESGIKHQYTIN